MKRRGFLGIVPGLFSLSWWARAQEPVSDPAIVAVDRKSTRLNSSHSQQSRMPSSA